MSDDDIDKCAACGKAGGVGTSLMTCAACKMVKYCSASCQKAHRPNHKKECKKRAAELFEEALFEKPPPPDECPICMVHLPLESDHQKYQACCGKTICCGCIYAEVLVRRSEGKDINCRICPFCRAPEHTTEEELVERIKKRTDANDAVGIRLLGNYYENGTGGFPQDNDKAIELWLRAGELGDDRAYFNIAKVYFMRLDMESAMHYFALAAMKGHLMSRHQLACLENNAGNYMKAAKHFIIAAEAGLDESLEKVREYFLHGDVSKEEYAKALRAHQKSREETKSEGRAGYSAVREHGAVDGIALNRG